MRLKLSPRSISSLLGAAAYVTVAAFCSDADASLNLAYVAEPSLAQQEGQQERQQETEPEPPGIGVRTAESCALCHLSSTEAEAMRDRGGATVAPVDLWRSTMMANSSRDPFWRAAIDAEMAATPAAAASIAEECMNCHAPLAHLVGLEEHGSGDPLHALSCDGDLGELAQDGVSCTICHGISPEGLGAEKSFNAGYEINPWRKLYGPHEEPFTGPMMRHSGFEPAYGEHMTSSSLCATCHVQVTDTRDAEGAATGARIHEQTIYLEWRNSSFSDQAADGSPIAPRPDDAQTCQHCHVPKTSENGSRIRTQLARNPGGFDFGFVEKRSPFGRHLFVGGNTLVLSMLRDFPDELGTTAGDDAFNATIAATRDQLAHRSASLAISESSEAEDLLLFDVTIQNLTGHKLPSGHPSRRMWLEVIVTDADGAEVFASGRHDAAGRLVSSTGEVLPTEMTGGPVEPHRATITAEDQVARYRSVMSDPEGAPTHLQSRAASWLIDDRILPRGWRADHPDAATTAPYGTADDSDYAPDGPSSGQDTVSYRFSRTGRAPYKIAARLLYQPISPRWADELTAYDSPAIQRFTSMYEATPNTPEVLAAGER